MIDPSKYPGAFTKSFKIPKTPITRKLNGKRKFNFIPCVIGR